MSILKKNQLRARIKNERNSLTNPFMKRSASALLSHANAEGLLKNAKNIAFYLSFKGEISCKPLIELALEQKKNCYIPKVFPNQKRGLWFLPYKGKSSIDKGNFGISEPTASCKDAIRPSQLDVIFMPLVAYDNQGNRVGMGGGYYDWALSNLKHSKNPPQLIGLAYNFQKVNAIPSKPWDIKMDAIITPAYFKYFPID